MATYYIHTSGNDTTGTGTNGAPWKTISKAHTEASSGDTIIVKSSVAQYTWADQTFTKSLTIVGETTTPSNQVFDGAGGEVKWRINDNVTVTVQYLEFQDAATSTANATGFPIFCLAEAANSIFTMTDCIIHDIVINRSAVEPVPSLFGSQGFGTLNGMVITVKRTAIYGIAATGTGSSFILAHRNEYTRTGGNNLFENVTVYLDGAASQISHFFKGGATGTTEAFTMRNCIVSCPNAAITWKAASTNLVESTTYSDLHNVTSPTAGTGNITSDPLFVDAANDNFNLRPTSPCINTGTLI